MSKEVCAKCDDAFDTVDMVYRQDMAAMVCKVCDAALMVEEESTTSWRWQKE